MTTATAPMPETPRTAPYSPRPGVAGPNAGWMLDSPAERAVGPRAVAGRKRVLAGLVGVLRAVVRGGGEADYLAAAGWIDANVPVAPIDWPRRLPVWFARGWRGERVVTPAYRYTTAPAVAAGVRQVAGLVFDHWGAASVCGVTALVSEPYCDYRTVPELVDVIRRVGDRAGAVGVFGRLSCHNPPRTWRCYWFPHPDALAELLEPARRPTQAK